MIADDTSVVALSVTNIMLGVVTLGVATAISVAVILDALDRWRTRLPEPTRSEKR